MSLQKQPIFLIGWFRSGTTMFWNLLRRSGHFTCYYEPFHEYLLENVTNCSDGVDPSHSGVDNYWSEYEHIPAGQFHNTWKPWFGRDRFVLDENDVATDLFDFISLLIERAPKRPVLKFVRANFRVSWLRKNFPKATIIFLARSPRAVWTSMVGRENSTDELLASQSTDDLGFINYMLKVSSEIGLHVPGHPYCQFYALWREVYREVTPFAEDTWWYEDAINNFDNWFDLHLSQVGLLNTIPDFTVSQGSISSKFHSNSWYLEQEMITQLALHEDKIFKDSGNNNEVLLLKQLQELQDIRFQLEINNYQLQNRVNELQNKVHELHKKLFIKTERYLRKIYCYALRKLNLLTVSKQ